MAHTQSNCYSKQRKPNEFLMSCFLKAENIIFLRWMTKKNLFFHTECKLFQWSSSDIGSSNGIGDWIWWHWIHWCTFPTTINDVHKHWVKLKSIVAISFMFRPISDVLPAAFPMHFNLNCNLRHWCTEIRFLSQSKWAHTQRFLELLNSNHTVPLKF